MKQPLSATTTKPATTFRDDLAPITCPTCQSAPKSVAGGVYTCPQGHTWTPQERAVKAR